MKIAVYSCQTYDREYLTAAAGSDFDLSFFDARLTPDTTPLADGCEAVCCFVNDQLDADVLQLLASVGVRLILLRCAGFNNVDLNAASRIGLTVMRVPEYSPHAVAEHTLALLLCVNRNLHRAWGRVREGDFRLQGLLGFDLYGKTIGVVGTGRIGACVCRILLGFGCRVLAFDKFPSDELHQSGVQYVPMQTLLAESLVITLHCPLTEETMHLINRETLAATKPGVILINTSRGGLVNTAALIEGLKSRHVSAVALDVYEEESSLFFVDHSEDAISDDVFARLLTFPNVLITGHQGFFTHEALSNIAATTIHNAQTFADGAPDPATVICP